MSSTSIEWTDKAWNPVRGCSRVSPGCDNCYAMGQAHRFAGEGKPYEGLTTIRRGRVDWAGHARLVPEMLEQPLRWKRPRRIFVNSMSDLFHESLSDEDIDRVFAVMARCPQHTFQVLTKRPKRMLAYLKDSFGRSTSWEETEELRDAQRDVDGFDDTKTDGDLRLTRHNEEALRNVRRFSEGIPLPNVLLGVSVENQKTADERIPLLLQCPAAVRFVSAEPLLGELDLSRFMWPTCWHWDAAYHSPEEALAAGAYAQKKRQSLVWAGSRFLKWVIVGGESGPGARPCNVEWTSAIVRQCKDAGVPVFVKQLGAVPLVTARRNAHWEWRHVDRSEEKRFTEAGDGMWRVMTRHKKGADMSEWPNGLRVGEFPEACR